MNNALLSRALRATSGSSQRYAVRVPERFRAVAPSAVSLQAGPERLTLSGRILRWVRVWYPIASRVDSSCGMWTSGDPQPQ
jgi:hypothetical protein